ncbi:MAG: hypothetical protein FWG79_09720, partial [Bacteroidales bacterium]|nr:hypothetical protein [Bacteroidales bacterium]
MKTKKITISLLITASWLAASAFTVSRNTVVTIGKNTQMKLSNVDLRNDGVLIGDTASMLIMSATREQKISGNDTYLSSLKIDGKVNSNVGVLSLDGDLIMESGVLNIGTNTLVIYGELLGETETSYAWATTGTIEQRMAYLPAGRQVSILGFTFTPLTDAYDFCVIRSHNPIIRISRDQTIYSAKRVFTFPTMVDMTDVADVEKQAFMHEIGNMYKPT